MTTASELFSEDARTRFSHTKALFEQLERQQEVTCNPSVLVVNPHLSSTAPRWGGATETREKFGKSSESALYRRLLILCFEGSYYCN
ncbi:unnamed protein product [Heligmosomoides polygyrus]|uniref:BCAS3 domain-containing protein n=1 Tax=Heligmosomoides polygyrus TaxID=6339 RepID=A0A183FHY6_HELPZ|nr:unnamed protein product [Heligmosomoides polygyrus]